MKLPTRITFSAWVCGVLLALSGSANAQLQLRSGNFNSIGSTVPNPNVGPPAVTPQFAAGQIGSGGTNAISDTGALTVQFPSGGNIVLLRSSIGVPFSSAAPRYLLGDEILRPLVKTDGSTLAPANYWRSEPVKAGEVFTHTSGLPATDAPVSGGFVPNYYYSPHAGKVFAAMPGSVTLTWVSRLPETDGRYQFATEIFSVSSSATKPAHTIFWTEKSFTSPRVQISPGQVVDVKPVFNASFPASVATEYATPGAQPNPTANTNLPAELRTFWFSNVGGVGLLNAYNREGRLFVEYLGAPRQDGTSVFLGFDIVDVVRSAPAGLVSTSLGDEILPIGNAPTLVASPVVTSTPEDPTPYFYEAPQANGSVRYYAERENASDPNRVQFYWLEPGINGMFWPKQFNKYFLVWPTATADFAHYTVGTNGSASATGITFPAGQQPTLVYQDDRSRSEALVDGDTQRFIVGFGSDTDNRNRSLLRFLSGDKVWYVRVDTQSYDRSGFVDSDGSSLVSTATVGQRLERPSSNYALAGFIASGTGYNPAAWSDPFNGVEQAGTGAIIPVNAKTGNNTLVVWWFSKVNAPNASFSSFYVPSKKGSYTVSYPASPDTIVLASNAGSGDLSGDQTAGSLYVENDSTKIGYNPNEEHAMLLAGRVYAMREDLNVTSGVNYTSQPFALLSYTDPVDARPAMRVFQVVRENVTHTFNFPILAGSIVQGPMPLPLLPLPVVNEVVKNTEVTPINVDPPADGAAPASYKKFTYTDRKGFVWVYRGPHGAGSPQLSMQLYYNMVAGFFIPGMPNQPAVGTILPYLREAGQSGTTLNLNDTPLTIHYTPTWPVAPQLRVAETLTLAKFGLPGVRGQTSANVLYHQSEAAENKKSVTLHDPTREKTFAMAAAPGTVLSSLPSSAVTTSHTGRTYFQKLPPHLQALFFFNPVRDVAGTLVLLGQFQDEIAGEDYLHLNTLSVEDVEKLKAVVDISDSAKSKWDDAVDALSTRVENFKEDPVRRGTYIVDNAGSYNVGKSDASVITSSDQAVDSYALTATGSGQGYVTLLFGDGKAFTPAGEPVSMQVIKVVPELYTGELKTLLASNPLDEQVTLRHTGDYAARPQDYEFEWRYAPPNNGVAPPTYTFVMQSVIGAAEDWKVVQNPAAALPSAAEYTATGAVPLPRDVVVRDASYNSARPGIVMRPTTDVNFTTVPAQIIFSAAVDGLTGFVVHVNGIPALAYRAPVAFAAVSADASVGLAAGGLTAQFSLLPGYFQTGDNRIEVALYTQADALAVQNVDFLMQAAVETDLVIGGAPWIAPNGTLSSVITVGGSPSAPLGSPLLVMSDNYFTMRYRPKASTNSVAGTTWSRWMPANLVEGWIKRVLAGINPFNQRMSDLFNNQVDLSTSILTQAGKRWEGDVALNLANINEFGLIEIYETVLNRGKIFSIDNGYDYAPANDALLLAAGYLSDLYTVVGDEAFADAANPTIALDGQSAITEVNTSRFAFEGQTASVLEEELALLRGRDDFLSPLITTTPSYNRLFWNYTRGINSGEVLYAVNYNIKDNNNDGTINAADAYVAFPQGHGDAYGHYLTALTGYYSLLTNSNFAWTPRSEGVSVLGQTVQVDYFDERKFAGSAAAVARTAEQIAALTFRQQYNDATDNGWDNYRDNKLNTVTNQSRQFGLDEWVSRGTQGAYINWVVGNAMLLNVDNNVTHTGIQKIDRTTVPELGELVSSALSLQTTIDNANAHLNPLGLSPGAVAFDISPTELKRGKSHFEQVNERALRAVLNAKGAFDQASKMNHLLRSQGNQSDDYGHSIELQEAAYPAQLIEIYGQPFSGDVGAGKTYAQGYEGPDLDHWFIVDRATDTEDLDVANSWDLLTSQVLEPVNIVDFSKSYNSSVLATLKNKAFLILGVESDYLARVSLKFGYTGDSFASKTVTLRTNRFIQYSDTYLPNLGARPETGELQKALMEVSKAQLALIRAGDGTKELQEVMLGKYQLIKDMINAHEFSRGLRDNTASANSLRNTILDKLASLNEVAKEVTTTAGKTADAVAEGLPKSVGLANDVTAPARGVVKTTAAVLTIGQKIKNFVLAQLISKLESASNLADVALERDLERVGFALEERQAYMEFQQFIYNEYLPGLDEVVDRSIAYKAANEHLLNVLARANRVLTQRETFRQRAAAIIQGYRSRDLTYRTFRNEALEQYRSLFDLASRYTYLAAKSYDYETGLLGSTQGQTVFSKIVASRSLGDLTGNIPQATGSTTGDAGLAGVMARMNADFSVAEGRLGINNPDANGTLFSLRREKFRILDASTSDNDWAQVLQQHIVPNVMADTDVAANCLGIRKPNGSPVPGIVIEFSTTVEHGLNFFGLPLAAADHAYSPASFATKIYSVGTVLSGYIGMDPYSFGNPTAGAPNSADPNALSATPYMYLIPVGTDYMRAPLGDTGLIRGFDVADQALPLPFNLGASSFNSTQFFNSDGTLTEQSWITRKHQPYRPVANSAFFYSTIPAEFTSSRLVGRSVWNGKWKLVIPAYTLLNDEQGGLNRFVASVKDIQIFLRTYSNSGN